MAPILRLVVTPIRVLMRPTRERILLGSTRFTRRRAPLLVPILLTAPMKILPPVTELLPTVPPTCESLRNMTWLVLTPRRFILEPFTRLLGRFMLLFEVLSAARGHPLHRSLRKGAPVVVMVPLLLVGVRL